MADGTVSGAAGEVGDLDWGLGVVLHLDGAGDGLVLSLDQLNNVGRVIAESPS